MCILLPADCACPNAFLGYSASPIDYREGTNAVAMSSSSAVVGCPRQRCKHKSRSRQFFFISNAHEPPPRFGGVTSPNQILIPSHHFEPNLARFCNQRTNPTHKCPCTVLTSSPYSMVSHLQYFNHRNEDWMKEHFGGTPFILIPSTVPSLLPVVALSPSPRPMALDSSSGHTPQC